MLPSRSETLALVDKYASTTRQHLLQVGTIMEYFAWKLSEDSEYWWTVGVLHDIDWDFIMKDGVHHLREDFDRITDEIILPEEVRADIRSHGHFLPWIIEKPDTLVRKYINAVDELSWFIWAYFRMIPSESVMDIKPSSIRKKLKDMSFAAGIDRGEAMNCESLLWIPLETFVEDVKIALSQGQWKK